MKELLVLGMLTGMVFGAFLAHTCKPVQDLVEKGKKEIKKQVNKM